DQRGRKAILEVHTRNVPLADDVDLGTVASSTPGMVGADLRNLVNEAAMMAARRGHEKVQINDFSDAFEKVVLGTERKIMMSEDGRCRTGYHKNGNALIVVQEEGDGGVGQGSVIPVGTAVEVDFEGPDGGRDAYEGDYLHGRLMGILGGRAAEEGVFGNTSTG